MQNLALKTSSSTHFSTQNATRPTLLVVDDDRSMLMYLEQKLQNNGFDIISSRSGKEALELLDKHKTEVEAILLDREMPEMNGLEVVAKIYKDANLQRIPIIMVTGSNKPEQVKEGIDAGVYYYLSKPIEESLLNSVVSAAIRESRQRKILYTEMRRHRKSFSLIESCRFMFSTLDEAEDLACLIANYFPDPEKVVIGIMELLINAVEHGNLEIKYDEKTRLLETNSWRDEVLRRQNMAEYNNRMIEIVFKKTEDSYHLQITDEGEGFNWQNYLTVDPARAKDNHGRGIAQANMFSFDRLVYNDKGNRVLATVSFTPENTLTW